MNKNHIASSALALATIGILASMALFTSENPLPPAMALAVFGIASLSLSFLKPALVSSAARSFVESSKAPVRSGARVLAASSSVTVRSMQQGWDGNRIKGQTAA